MAATAQDSMAPLRSGEGKKDEDREEESTPVNVAFPITLAECDMQELDQRDAVLLARWTA